MKIAVVGAGVTGLGAAWQLSRKHDVTLYESHRKLGGHAHTVTVKRDGRDVPVDVGFIVYNEPNYPNLTHLFDALGVETEFSEMSFAFSGNGGDFEYSGSLAGLFAQKRNLLRPRLWVMLRDLLRFYREAPRFLDQPEPGMTLGGYLEANGYSRGFLYDHLLPMAAAIWSSPLEEILDFPAESFMRFNDNHGLLQMNGRPEWRTVSGGSRNYVERMAEEITRIRVATPVSGISREKQGVTVFDAHGDSSQYDQVVFATHADVTLSILGKEATQEERAILGAFSYQRNFAVLHQDPRLMPKRKGVWSSWNYISQSRDAADPVVSVTYWMNRLQNLDPEFPLFVSLNSLTPPAPDLTLRSFIYDHPQFDLAALTAQRQLPTIQGVADTWFCGSYCGYGFHEDGLQAGLAVAAALGCPPPWADKIVPRSPAAEIAKSLQPAMAAE